MKVTQQELHDALEGFNQTENEHDALTVIAYILQDKTLTEKEIVDEFHHMLTAHIMGKLTQEGILEADITKKDTIYKLTELGLAMGEELINKNVKNTM